MIRRSNSRAEGPFVKTFFDCRPASATCSSSLSHFSLPEGVFSSVDPVVEALSVKQVQLPAERADEEGERERLSV